MISTNAPSPALQMQKRERLLFRVDPIPMESPRGYLCRVSHDHRYYGAKWLLELAGIPNKGRLELDARGEQLAHVLRLRTSEWLRMCYRPARGKTKGISFLGQVIGIHQLNYRSPRVCPRCVRERSVWWAVWDLKLASACPIHREFSARLRSMSV